MPRFVKGISGNKSRGKEHSWARIGFWIDRINLEWEKLTPNQKVHYSVELTKLLVSKAKSLPADPDASVVNAAEIINELKQIESKTKSITTDVTKAEGV